MASFRAGFDFNKTFVSQASGTWNVTEVGLPLLGFLVEGKLPLLLHLLPVVLKELAVLVLWNPHPFGNVEPDAAGRETRMESTGNRLAQVLQSGFDSFLADSGAHYIFFRSSGNTSRRWAISLSRGVSS